MKLQPRESLTDRVTVRPANEAECEDLQTVLGTRGQAAFCQSRR